MDGTAMEGKRSPARTELDVSLQSSVACEMFGNAANHFDCSGVSAADPT